MGGGGTYEKMIRECDFAGYLYRKWSDWREWWQDQVFSQGYEYIYMTGDP